MLSAFARNHRPGLRLLAALLALLSLLAVAVTQVGAVSRLDLHGIEGLRETSLPTLTGWVFAVTFVGNTHTILVAGLLAVAALLAFRHWRSALALALSVAITEVLVAVIKHAVERPRPPAEEALTQANGFSFPSGHAAAATALYALLAWLAIRHLRGAWRVAAVAAGGLVVVAVGLSRVYLGVHYPTDVMAGWLVGGALATASWLAASLVLRVASPPAPRPA